MSYPRKPDIDYSYTGFQQSQGDNSFPGTYVDNDLANLKAAIDETIDFVTTSFQSTGILKANRLPGGDVLDEYIESTAGDVVLTHADVVLTHADAADTAADRVQTGLDRVATAADRVQTGLDRVATAADRVQTGLDRVATAADVVATGLDAAATAAYVVATGLDAAATAADRVQTGLDAATATTQAGLAQAAANAAANSLDSFDDRYLGSKAADPAAGNDGNPLLAGAVYWNTTAGLKIYNGSTLTWEVYTAASGILAGNNLSDVADAATAFSNIKQAATANATGVVELATDAETQTGTDTARAITPANLTAKEATSADYRGNTADRILTTDQVWSAASLVGLTDGANIALDLSSAINFSVTLAGNRQLDNPTNPKVGQTGIIVVTQDGTGSRTLSYGTNYKFAGAVAPTLTTTASRVDYLAYWVETSTRIWISASKDIR